MEIAVISVNHNIAPLEIREKVTFTGSKKKKAYDALSEKGILELIILSTCNRSEIYFVSNDIHKAIEDISLYLEEYSQSEDIRKYLVYKKEDDAIFHIFKVTAGLESLVIGEDQILGQVRDSLQFAMENGHSGKLLNKVFREAVTKAKHIKHKYKISENPTSISYVGIKLIKEKISLVGKKVLIIGAGNMGKLSLRYMLDEKLDKLYITNRTHNKLNEILEDTEHILRQRAANAKDHNEINESLAYIDSVEAILYEERYDYLKDVDLLISTTASPHTIFQSEDMPELDKELYILDLALPRDVEKEIGNMKNIHLYEIDDLKKVIDENLDHRESLIKPILDIIEEAVTEISIWKNTLIADPTIEKMFYRCDEIKRETIEIIVNKTDISNKERKVIEKMVGSAIKRSVKPILNLKTIEDKDKLEDYIKVVSDLFGV